MPIATILWRGALLGALAAAALPPLTLVPLLLIAIPGLLRLIGQQRSWQRAGLAGLAFGIGYHAAGLYWITDAILVMADRFWWAVPIAVPLLAGVLALFIAVPCAVVWLAPAGWPRVAALAGGWVLGDLARQFAFSGFPWNLLGSTWEFPGLVGLAFMQPAAWVGVHGLTLATLLLASYPTLGYRARLCGVATLLLWGGAGALRLEVPAGDVSPPGLMAVIVQGNVSEADHRDHGGERAWGDRVFDRYLALTRQGIAQTGGRPALVVWPETASPYALAQDAGARQAVADASAPALITLAGTERFETASVAHNSLVAVAPGGVLAGIYDKSHLVPFGEYFPRYAHFLLGEQGFVPGPGLQTMHLPGLPAIGPLICYEAIFPGRVVQPNDRPGLLVNITNDAWFGDTAGPRQHLAAARMRSVEEGLPMLRAANTGVSAIIDAHGRIVAQLALDRSGTLVAPVPGALRPTLAGRFRLVVPTLAALSLLGTGLISRQSSRVVQKNREQF